MTARAAVALLMIAAIVMNGVWHVGDANLHGHTHIAATTAADMESPVPGDAGHVDDPLVHPAHQHAYLYRIEVATPSVRVDRVVDAYVNRFVAGHASRLFRPPAV